MLKSLRVRDFRCLEKLELELHPHVNLFTGRNAQGKTSVLEAICVLMRLQSPRTSAKAEWIRFDAASCALEGIWQDALLRYTQTATARRLAVQGAVCPRMDDYLRQSARIVWMDHADMNLTRGSAEHRRRYLDFAAGQIYPEYREALRAYERVLRSRNFLLKRDAAIPWRQVDAYSEVLHRHASVLRRSRAELVAALVSPAGDVQQTLSAGDEKLGLQYLPGYEAEHLGEELFSFRAEEERLRSTVVGPHRDDLGFLLNGRDATSYASEGQQRSLSVALKVAQARVLEDRLGAAPLLLLDDVFGELDRHRRQALLSALPPASQIFITTTSLDWLDQTPLEAWHWQVQRGALVTAGD